MTVWAPFYIPLVPPTYEFDISLIEKGFARGTDVLDEAVRRLEKLQAFLK